MIYYALYTGHGHGCDYTIGCNETFQKLRAVGMDGAKLEAIAEAPHGISRDQWGSVYTEKILVLAVVDECDLAPEIVAERARKVEEQQADEVAKKRAEFERLKRELGQ